MSDVTFKEFEKSVRRIPYQKEQSYLISYREFLIYFTNLKKIESHDFVIAAHFVYGWMPKILRLRSISNEKSFVQLYPILTDILNKVKKGFLISDKELNILVKVINNSVVGVSKLLHFVNPENYAIWDSNVYRYIYEEKPHHYRVNNMGKYKSYLNTCSEISHNADFPKLHSEINEKIGYGVSSFRAIEWVMYMDG
jgi:hypothetical protein